MAMENGELEVFLVPLISKLKCVPCGIEFKIGVIFKVQLPAGTPDKGKSQTVYRAFGGDARAQGFSWTTVNPTSVKNFRNLAGLPSGGASGAMNTADFMIKGKVNINNIIKSRSALPLDGNIGGLPELIIDPKNVRLIDFKVLKP